MISAISCGATAKRKYACCESTLLSHSVYQRRCEVYGRRMGRVGRIPATSHHNQHAYLLLDELSTLLIEQQVLEIRQPSDRDDHNGLVRLSGQNPLKDEVGPLFSPQVHIDL